MTKIAKKLASPAFRFRWKTRGVVLFRAVFLTGICFMVIYPLLLDFSFAFRPEHEFYDPAVIFIPKEPTMDNIRTLIDLTDYWNSLRNTSVVSSASALLQLLSCIFIGYGFGRFKFPFKRFWFACVVLTLIVPFPIIFAPLYIQFNSFNPLALLGVRGGIKMVDTFWPISLLSATGLMYRNGMFIYMFTQFFRNLPKELDESAMLDGAGRLRIFYRISLPNAGPVIAAVFLFAFVWLWTDITYSSAFMVSTRFVAQSSQTIIARLQAQHGLGSVFDANVVLQQMYAKVSVVLCIIPLIILYVFCQRFFTESIERSGIIG